MGHHDEGPPTWAIELTTSMREMRDEQAAFRADVCEHFRALDTITDELGKRTRTSKGPSAHDLQTQAELAAEVVARQELAATTAERIERIEAKTDAQTVMLTGLSNAAGKALANPILRTFVYAALSFGAAWFASHR